MFNIRRTKMNKLDYAKFYSAAQKGESALIKFMLSVGFNIHEDNDLALRCAAESGQVETVKLLWENGAYIHALNNAALRWSAYYGETEVVSFLLTHGADFRVFNDEALCNAIRKKHIDTVQCILAYYNSLPSDCHAHQLAQKSSNKKILEIVEQKIA